MIATIASFNGQDPSLYGRCLGGAWKVGRRGIDDGVVIVLAEKDRIARITVGDGVTAKLTDMEAKAIIDRDMVPAFRAGRFGAGVKAAVASIDREFGQAVSVPR